MFNIIPLVIIFICLAVILYIVLRKFPQLARIKTETIQKEKETQAKNKILNERLKRKTEKASKAVGGFASSFKSKVSKGIQEAKEKAEEKKKELDKPKPDMLVTKEDYEKSEQYIEKSMEEAEQLKKGKENFKKAEKKYIDAIAQNPRNPEVYEKLGWLYYENKKYDEARETLGYVLKLDPDNAQAHYDLAEVDMEQGRIQEGYVHAKKASEMQPKNPKFISLQVELAIKLEDKVNAQMALQKLQDTNPDNAKIELYQEQIKEL